ncbi:MAG: hypothetical protein ACI88A_001417 [Paraglaciecola sp.]|jgi:hypothetical protein
MSNLDDYVSLICGLANSERLFLAKLPPMSRLRLEQRLKVLDEHDGRTLSKIESILDWRLQSNESSDQYINKQARKVYEQLQSDTLRSILRDKMELRTCIAALRRKALGQGAPDHTNWGFGRWVRHINHYWNEASFNLVTVFPWLPKAQQLIEQRDPEALERFVIERAFRQLQRFSGQHYFDFEAVVIYVLKWNIIDRSARYNVEGAKRRFAKLVHEGLGEFVNPEFEDKL